MCNSPSEVLSRRLVPFRDVDELQKRNLELLAVVRELTGKAEAEEQAAASGQVSLRHLLHYYGGHPEVN